MARTKKTGEMTTEAAKEIAEKIDSFEVQTTQGSFVPHGRQDVLTAAIERPEHTGRVRAAGAGVTIKQYFGSAPRTSRSSSSLPPEELQQLSQQIRDQLEEDLHCLWSLWAGPRVSTKESCIDPSGNDPETSDSDRCGLYIETNPARLVALGRVYEGSTVVHNTPLLPGQVKVGVEEVKDPDAPVPVPTDEVSLVGQAIHTFLAWPTHLVKSLSQQVLYSYYMFLLFELIHSACLKLGHLTLFHEQPIVSPAKPPQKPDPEVDDPLYMMTLTIPELFLRPYQVTWDATVFGVFNIDFSLYIKHEDLFEITHGGQCLSISVLQLWILHLTETSMRVGNFDIYGFLEPQSIQREAMAWRGNLLKNIKELRFLMCQSSPASSATRAFVERNYKELKTLNPKLPILIRECSGVEPQLWARYDLGVEKGIKLEGLSEAQIFKALEDLVKAGQSMKA
ncbi:NADH dehydrogenase [ubiquinone] 1 alpha subcomplex subunit 2 [Glycine soja]|uniref:NADH dehydrogenase [ubiquinone] 1 alpha subcomplex subunit 2 n=2 Tax=Glycine soja TaxID=3848 RepID=A0A445L1V9_GLYSO|nr:NADH dehydrogenase [ubiquinone] 1 alpha subcomplex subunit 2 [Glycine soja]